MPFCFGQASQKLPPRRNPMRERAAFPLDLIGVQKLGVRILNRQKLTREGRLTRSVRSRYEYRFKRHLVVP